MNRSSVEREGEGTGALTPRDAFLLLLLLLLGLALRLDQIVASNLVIDSDEAIVGLMAKHILEGKEIPTFYYGQHYMGSLEPLLVAGARAILGAGNLPLKIVPLIFSLLLIPIVFLIANECAGKRAGLVAALLTALSPQSLLVWSTKARGGFIEILIIGGFALLLALRSLRSREVAPQVIIAGFLLGLGWWVNNQIVYFFAPVALGFLCRLWREGLRECGRQMLRGVSAFLVGSAPYWLYNLQNDFASFGIFGRAPGGDISEHLIGALTVSLPMLLGAKNFWDDSDLFPGATGIVLSLYTVILLLAIVRALGKIGTMRSHDQGVATLIVGTFPLFALAVFSASSFGSLVQAPRYLLPTYIGLFVLFGVGMAPLLRTWPRFATALLTVVTIVNLYSAYPGKRAIPGEPFVFAGERVSRDHSELYAWLKARDVRWIRTNYWIGYRVAFETEEATRFRIFQAPFQERIERYREDSAGLALEQMPLVLVPTQAAIVEPGLEALGFEYERERLSGYIVLHSFRQRFRAISVLPSEALTVQANYNAEAVRNAVDGLPETRWGSAHPQTPGMRFEVSTAIDNQLTSIKYFLSDWPHDYPRSLEIHAIDKAGNRLTLLTADAFAGIVYYFEGQHEFQFFFPPVNVGVIELVQLGSHPLFDWTIAELELWQ